VGRSVKERLWTVIYDTAVKIKMAPNTAFSLTAQPSPGGEVILIPYSL
jgi:hypothetical protein